MAARTTRRADAAVKFAAKVAREHGHVNELDLRAVKAAGYDDAQVIEIVQHVALNVFTNYINMVGQTDIDFPAVRHARLLDFWCRGASRVMRAASPESRRVSTGLRGM